MTLSSQPFEWGAAMLAQGGQPDCGDQYWISPLPNGLFLGVVDGLGHGPKAAAAALAAVEVLRSDPHDDLIALMERCHQALIGTRGAVITLAALDVPRAALTWISVGNVAGLLVRAGHNSQIPAREHLLQRGGVVGYRLPPLRLFSEQLLPGDTLILTTDGIRSAFLEDLPLHLPPQPMAETILDGYNRQTDDATVVAARYKG